METLPAMDQDELLCIQGQIFLGSLHQPREFNINMIRHHLKIERKRSSNFKLSKRNKIKQINQTNPLGFKNLVASGRLNS